MNPQLKKAYEAFYLSVGSKLGDKSIANPLFIDYDKSDEKADTKKIMVFGRETNSWGDTFGKTTDQLLSVYNEFYNRKDAQNMRSCYHLPGYFWNEYYKFEKECLERNPSVKLIWNNIVKIGGLLGSPPDALVNSYMKEAADLIRTEIEIIEPSAVLFLTSPDFDRHIKTVFDDAELTPVNLSIETDLLARVKSGYLPKKAIRTFHPHDLNAKLERDYQMDLDKFRNIIVSSLCC